MFAVTQVNKYFVLLNWNELTVTLMATNMMQLKYQIEDKVIAQLLGVQNFTSDEAAVLELVKNAYDARATEVEICFKPDSMVIRDNGCGMSREDILDCWMRVGRSQKDYSVRDKDRVRVLAGSKGIGRFALARLGEEVELLSKREGAVPVCWVTDWNLSKLSESEAFLQKEGTTITISKLREQWGSEKVKKLADFLSRTYNDTIMKINICYRELSTTLKEYFEKPVLGVNCLSVINLKYDSSSTTLTTIVNSDEFSEKAQIYCSSSDLNHFQSKENLSFQLDNRPGKNPIDLSLQKNLQEIGDFSAEFYFAVAPTKIEVEKFLYKHHRLETYYPPGVILYRNAFSISSMDGNKDWLGLGKRSRMSPAAATHPTGSWRVRENQLAGKVLIDKKENGYLQDLSNRQGLNENAHYNNFVRIIQFGISQFEQYRQSLIRQINQKNIQKQLTPKTYMQQVVAKPISVLNFSEQECELLASEIKVTLHENKQLVKDRKEIEGQYRYEVRVLNVLATMGLKAFSAAHELKNDRTNLIHNVRNIKRALIRYQCWDILTSEENTKISSRNVPKLLEENRTINKKITTFMNAVLGNIEKRRFFAKNLNVREVVEEMCVNWKEDYSSISFDIDIPENLRFELSEDVFSVIFDNLILNSIQQNEHRPELKIRIQIYPNSDRLVCKYSDNGDGLSMKYFSNPRKILEVHETTRNDGHGLGMWILNNTCLSTGGEVTDINGQNGFHIEFTLGSKLS